MVDVSLLATAMWTLSSDILAALGGDEPKASSGRGPSVNPVVGMYRTKDGRHIQLVFLEADRYWPDFCRLIGRPDLIDDPRFSDLRARGENAEACRGRARRRIRQTNLCRVEGAPPPAGRSLGAGAIGPRIARRPTGRSQWLYR